MSAITAAVLPTSRPAASRRLAPRATRSAALRLPSLRLAGPVRRAARGVVTVRASGGFGSGEGKSGEGKAEGSGSPLVGEEGIAFEPKKKGPKVDAPQVRQALGQESTPETEAEALAVTALGLVFLLIMLEGLVLAFSGFLPEAIDTFATETLYNAFSPTVGLFLVMSSAYGVWKSKQFN